MKAKFDGSYKKSDNNGGYRNVFRYVVSGSQQEIEQYQEAQGVNYRETESGQPLFFSNAFGGTSINLIKTDKNRYVIDTSAFAQAEGMLGNFTNPAMIAAMSNIIAKQLLGVKDTESVEA
jgi:hypothetical protein